jgi:hypothetical protein
MVTREFHDAKAVQYGPAIGAVHYAIALVEATTCDGTDDMKTKLLNGAVEPPRLLRRLFVESQAANATDSCC